MVISTPTEAVNPIIYPYTFVNGQILPAGQLNGNFDAVSNIVDDSLTNDNIAVGANIALSKLALTATALDLMASGNPTWASGVTGDTVARIQLNSNGLLQFGPGSATAVDSAFARISSTLLGARDAANAAYIDFGAANLVANTALKLVNTNTATITPAALGANRAITFVDPGATASLRCTTGTFNSNGVVYTDGTNALSTATGGAGIKILTSVSGAAPSFSTLAGTGIFGGNGSDGAITIVASSDDTVVSQRNATTFQINNTFTLGVQSGSVINATSAITIGQGASGQLVTRPQAGGRGGLGGTPTSTPQAGGGDSGGAADFSLRAAGYGGGGGASGGNGGAGGGNTAVVVQGGRAINGGVSPPSFGSGGGGGGNNAAANSGGAGGAGGGKLRICGIGSIVISAGATVSCVGTSGSGGSGINTGGGGGGGGGVFIIASQTSITNNGTINVTGGDGGASGAGTGGGGGGGSGGYVLLWSPSNTAGTITTTGGAAGAGGATAAVAGASGSTHVISGTPNLPLITWTEQHLDQVRACKPSNNRELAQLAAGNDLCLFWQYRSGSLIEKCEAIGSMEMINNDLS